MASQDAIRQRKYREKIKRQKVRLVTPTLQDFENWISGLKVPAGLRQGLHFELAPFQREFASAVFDDRYKLICLSTPRKNMKTSTQMLILAYFLIRVQEWGWNGGILSIAQKNSRETWHQLAQLVSFNEIEGLKFRKSPLLCIEGPRQQMLTFYGVDSSVGTSANHSLISIDEMDEFQEPARLLLEQMFTSTGARKGAKVITISVRGTVDCPFYDEIKERYEDGDESVWYREYSAPPGTELEDVDAIIEANPGIAAGAKSLEQTLEDAKRARSNSRSANIFKRLHMNMRVDMAAIDMIVKMSAWEDCELSEPRELSGKVWIGMDLGYSDAMSCLVLIDEHGTIVSYGAFAGRPDIEQRSLDDGAGLLYPELIKRGELFICGTEKKTCDVGLFIRQIVARHRDLNIRAVISDDARVSEAEDALVASGTGLHRVYSPRRRGRGLHGYQDVYDFMAAVNQQKIGWFRSKLLTAAIRNSKVQMTRNGNPEVLRQGRGRIDALDAALLCCGAFMRTMSKPRRKRRAPLFSTVKRAV